MSLGLAPELEVLPRSSALSEDEVASAALVPAAQRSPNEPYEEITSPNGFESPKRTSRAVIIHTALSNRISNVNAVFPNWFAHQAEEQHIKQEEISYDWAASNENDELPNISDIVPHTGRFESDLGSAFDENNILREHMSKISKFHDYDNESQSTESDPENSDCLESSRSRRSLTGKYKQPTQPRLGVFSMRPTGSNGQSDSNTERIPFHDKGKWPAADPGLKPAAES